MKNLYKFFIISAFVILSILTSNFVQATETQTPTTTAPAKSTLVATVNIKNAKIIFTDGKTTKIHFDLTNRTGVQTGVKYGVKLVTGPKNDRLIDEKVYDESLTLQENSSVSRDIVYTSPAELDGIYSLYLTSNNSSGFPFGIASLGQIAVKSVKQGVEIVTDSCYLQIVENGNKYMLNEGVKVSDTYAPILTCPIKNNTKEALSLVPLYETRYRSAYGDIAPITGGSVAPIMIKGVEEKSVSVTLPKGTIPQLYNTKMTLMKSGQPVSNSVEVHYSIPGATAVIQNISLNKDYYKKGDTAEASLLWTKSADSTISMSAALSNKEGEECAPAVNKTLVKDPNSPVTKIPFSITSSCVNPHIKMTLSDDKGTVLDTKEFNFESKSAGGLSISMLIILIVILLIIIMAVYIKRKKNNPDMNMAMNVIMPFFILMALLGFVSSPTRASADTYTGGADDDILTTVELDQNVYSPNGIITIRNISITSYASTTQSVYLKASNNGEAPVDLVPTQDINAGQILLIGNVILANAPSDAGDYNVTFTTGTEMATGVPAPSCTYKVIAEFSSFRFARFSITKWQAATNSYAPLSGIKALNLNYYLQNGSTVWGGPYTRYVYTNNSGIGSASVSGTAGYTALKFAPTVTAIQNGNGNSFNIPIACTQGAGTPYSNGQYTYANCFIADTKVKLADGKEINIQDVKIGDILKGEKTNNTVLGFHRPELGDGKLYSFNGGRYFVTAEHPFKTTDGWKSIDPSKTDKENIGIKVTPLKVGDTIITEAGAVKIKTIGSKEASSTTPLYNFMLDGDHTYYADGYLVHNKDYCSNASPVVSCNPGRYCIDSAGQVIQPPVSSGSCSLTCVPGEPIVGGTCPNGTTISCNSDGNKVCL